MKPEYKTAEFTNFSLKHFDPKTAGTYIPEKFKSELEHMINKSLNEFTLESPLGDFCIYVPIDNIFNVQLPTAKISRIKNRWINTSYVARQSHELPVLTRSADVPFWFKTERANYIVAVLYSRKQLLNEYNATKSNLPENIPFELSEDCDYGIVTLLASTTMLPDPMPPITAMRNALGKSEGGNGVKLNKDDYNRSVEFWNNNILIRKTNKIF